ncbi:MAG: hypothetical protein QOI74_3080 [Micromonosporaceae bacterium]|jgi:hypothetical protein|nr:hypothetical protein [Micromonosporaceae bacterium]
MSCTVETVRAEALFASPLQSSEHPEADAVRGAVAATLRSLGRDGCAGQLAGEFGEHPETAAARMMWAIATVRSVYRTPGASNQSLAMVG